MIDRKSMWRLAMLVVIFALIWAALAARLLYLHLGPNDELRARVKSVRTFQKETQVSRGRIFDAGGHLLALDMVARDVWVDPKAVRDSGHLEIIARHLARTLQLDQATIVGKLNLPDRRFEYLCRFLSEDQARAVERLQLQGVHFDDASIRHYPEDELMCHVLGFSNQEGGGGAGLELRLDKYLRGRAGYREGEKDGRKREVAGRCVFEVEPEPGADVHLTLDQNIQYTTEKALEAGIAATQAKAGWAIVERVRTGEILAMASRPAFNLNDYRHATNDCVRNRAIAYTYEPGSTFKVSVIAAALNEGTVTPDTIIDCENGRWMFHGKWLHDYHPSGKLTVADVLKKSSNIGAAKVALTLGEERLEKYLRAFNFGRPLGVDLPGEEGGLLYPRRRWNALSISRIPMGHEVAVTGLQMLGAVCCIANDGALMRPRVVRQVVDNRGRVVLTSVPEVIGQPIRPETARTMRGLLQRVTEEGGTGRKARVAGYDVAGKTGTAQKLVDGQYSSTVNISSFVGFLPADKPELGIIVVLDEPQGKERTGGAVCAPVFHEIATRLVRYLDVPPTRPAEQMAGASGAGGAHAALED